MIIDYTLYKYIIYVNRKKKFIKGKGKLMSRNQVESW